LKTLTLLGTTRCVVSRMKSIYFAKSKESRAFRESRESREDRLYVRIGLDSLKEAKHQGLSE
jgi:hypothetical protein